MQLKAVFLDRHLRARLGTAARLTVAQWFDLKFTTTAYVRLYDCLSSCESLDDRSCHRACTKCEREMMDSCVL